MSQESEWRESFDEFRAEISEYIDAGDHVVCVTRWTGRGKASGAVVDVAQVEGFADRQKALEAIGLQE